MKDLFVCINCLSTSPTLYTRYSSDVIRITECKICGSIVDKYVEYDTALIIIDLILQYKTAYRHVLINLNFKSFFRIVFIFLLCDAYEDWIERKSSPDYGESSRIFYDLEWTFYECLLRSLIEFIVYAVSLSLYPELDFWNIFAVLISVLAQFISGHLTQKYIGIFTNSFY
ncbi:hypothetical protein Mgra_00005452 [Meloidogyne graminicola]|uniref:Protein ARV n=1 Tax=Meloidogyne graminicola TaxID=189291 RepID=A0A8S9ZNR4_9BILA|nr:hypothetical protein Mgra_00005452 [Meloidogyne graminicola]